MKPNSQLQSVYQLVLGCALIRARSRTAESLHEFEQLLNAALPPATDESWQFVQAFYRANPHGYARHLMGSELECTVLWTDARCIVNRFRLQGDVHITRCGARYSVRLHRNHGELEPATNGFPG